MSNQRKSNYVSSPSYRQARNELIGWLGLFAFFTLLVFGALWLTGGVY